MSMDRATFFERITKALDRPAGAAEPAAAPFSDDALVRLVEPGADLLETYTTKARGAGMGVVHTSEPDLGSALIDLLAERGIDRVTLEIDDDALAGAARAALGERIVDSSAAGMDMHFDVDAGVCDAAAGIAETGSVAFPACPKRGRGVFIAPPRHVAILRERNIVPDLLDWLRAAGSEPGERPSATVLVTGPSKTADIEGILVTGVHGPGTVDVVVVTG